MMLHRHFSMEPNELLVEYGNVATPWPVLPPTVNSFDALEEYPPTVFGGKLVPRCWKVHNGSLIPTEFGYNPQGADYGSDQKLGPKGRYSEVEFDSGFVTAIVNTLVERNLQDIFGITVVDNVELDGIMGIERTIGRVSITLPVTIPLNSNHPQDIEEDGSQTQDDILDEVLQTGVESVWTFGCHQKMENSRILPARICWVCESCK
ncbi:hypothetical protein BDZ91DRAFT_751950 [Kalaharituber pfeilii]|nr:hypothetical protein BDZ91DRAFT_751950 [Kalaharituber pfeilii]